MHRTPDPLHQAQHRGSASVRRRGGAKRPAAVARTLHELPEDVLHAIMRRLVNNDAVKLASVHPTLRRAIGTLPSLQPSVILDVSPLRAETRTRSDTTAERPRQLRSNSFGAFRAAHPELAIDAMTVRLALPAALPRRIDMHAQFVTTWLPLRDLKHLCVETSNAGFQTLPQVRARLLS